MKVQVSKIQNSDETIIIVEYNDELFASSRSCDDCLTLTEDFCKEWKLQDEPEEIEIIPYMGSYFWSVNEQMIEVVQSNETSLQTDEEKEASEQEIENQITLFYDKIVEEETPAAIKRQKSIDRKHKLIKKQDLPKKVNFEMLVTSPYSIWNGGYEKAETQSLNETVQQGELAAQNLELFISLMKNPKFATKASFEIEKILKKTKTI